MPKHYPPSGPITFGDLGAQYLTLKKGEILSKISKPQHRKKPFNPTGPHGRFDHHLRRFTKDGIPLRRFDQESFDETGNPISDKDAKSRQTSYFGLDLETCIAEVFMRDPMGSYHGRIDLSQYFEAYKTSKELLILDLRSPKFRQLGMPQKFFDEQLKTPSYDDHWSWARRIYSDPFCEFKPIDGITWLSTRDPSKECYVLNERALGKIKFVGNQKLLDIRSEVEKAAATYRLEIK